jgi:hypothetical protein
LFRFFSRPKLGFHYIHQQLLREQRQLSFAAGFCDEDLSEEISQQRFGSLRCEKNTGFTFVGETTGTSNQSMKPMAPLRYKFSVCHDTLPWLISFSLSKCMLALCPEDNQ